MKLNKLLFLILLLNGLSIQLSFGQDKPKDYMSKFKGYEHSLNYGIISKMNHSSQSRNDSTSTDQQLLQRNSNVEYEYFDVVKSSMNIPMAQCHDSSGNTFITGASGNLESHSADITTIKIDQNGTIVWTVRIPSPSFTGNGGTEIALDSDGNIILTGYIWNINSMDIICAKINSGGQIVWQNTINNANNFDIPTAMYVNSTNEIFIAGVTHNDNRVTYYTAKLSSAGQLLWQNTEGTFPESTWNEPIKIMQDNAGAVIVSGFGFDEGDKPSMVTIKYATDGQQLWKRVKQYTTTLEDGTVVLTKALPNDFVVDDQNNIYTTGDFALEFATSTSTFKYDTNGLEIWNYNYQHEEENSRGDKILIHNNTLYVGGRHFDFSQGGYLLMSISLDGEQNWVRTTENLIRLDRFNMFEYNDSIILNSISYVDMSFGNLKLNTTFFSTAGIETNHSNYVFDNLSLGLGFGNWLESFMHDNNIIITLQSQYSVLGHVYETIKLNTSNNTSIPIWNSKLQEINATDTDVRQTVSDSNNNVYSIVYSGYVVNNILYKKIFLVKHNELGEVVWNKLIDDSEYGVTAKLNIDIENFAIVVLEKPTNNNGMQIFIKKISTDGVDIWDTSLPLLITGNTFLEVNNTNEIYIIGSVLNNDNSTNVFSVKLSPTGTVLSTNNYQPNESLYTNNIVTKAIINSAGELLICGDSGFFNSATFQWVWAPSLLKVDENGLVSYYNIYPLIPGLRSFTEDMVESGENIILAISSFEFAAGEFKVNLFAINQSGTLVWQNSFDEPDFRNTVFKLLKGTNPNTVYTVGQQSVIGSARTQVIKWELYQDATDSVLISPYNFPMDYFIDDQNIYILSQNIERLSFPRRIINAAMPFISAKVTKLDYNLVQSEEINLIGENYSLYDPRQFIRLNNDSLFISGKIYHEQGFFQGLYFFNIPYSPELDVPTYPENLTNQLFFNYPNPITLSETNVVFELQQNEFITLNLYDISGKFIKKILSGSYPQGANNINVKLPVLMDGVYILNLSNGTNSLYQKIVVKN